MYVDEMTDSVRNAVDITNKRRHLQMAYNEKTLKEKKGEIKTRAPSKDDLKGMSKDEIRLVVKDLEAEMKEAADNLDFERAADLRDQIISLKGLRKNKKRSNYIKSL